MHNTPLTERVRIVRALFARGNTIRQIAERTRLPIGWVHDTFVHNLYAGPDHGPGTDEDDNNEQDETPEAAQ